MKKLKYFFLILSLASLFLLDGCSTNSKDGPPSYNADVSRVPDAVPKPEAFSKSGNRPYVVFGKRYYILPTNKNYDAIGVASWYGTKFHKKSTSSGEPYDMLAMTAAHKSLPLPTYAQITNLKNGKKVIVKINDRGPFEHDRLIDLSYAAAKKLDIVGHGTAKVRVRTITAFGTHSRQVVYLQVGAFHNRTYAENLKQRLMPMLSAPVNIMRSLDASQELYRVQIGPLADADSAQIVNAKLKEIGMKGNAYIIEM